MSLGFTTLENVLLERADGGFWWKTVCAPKPVFDLSRPSAICAKSDSMWLARAHRWIPAHHLAAKNPG
jgi:hypothetical protein